jgi:hypothetical protein
VPAAGGDRLAHYAISGSNPPRWVSELAEELAGLAALGSPPWVISQRIRDAAATQRIPDLWFVTQLVAHEWDRLGIARVPGQLEAGGW